MAKTFPDQYAVKTEGEEETPLFVLNPRLIAEIDRALAETGPFGEVHLVKSKGKLRFIRRVDSQSLI